MTQGRVRIDSDAAARIGAGFVQVSQQRARLRAAALLCITVLALLIFFCKSVNPTRREANPSAFVNALDAPSAAEHFNRSAAMHNRMAIGVLAASMSSAALADAVQWRVEDGGNGHWYEVSSDISTWPAARDACVARGGMLACCETTAECNFLRGQYPAGTEIIFVGLFQDLSAPEYSEPSGGWKWLSGAPFDSSLWQPGEPNNYFDDERFGELEGPGRPPFLNDVIPGGTLRHFVEWSADCNNDGIVDYGQCRDGSLPDFNGNNIPDCCEQGTACVVGSYPVQGRIADGGTCGRHVGVDPLTS